MWTSFHVLTGHLHILFCEPSVEIFHPSFYWVICLLLLNFMRSLYIYIQVLVSMYHNIFSQPAAFLYISFIVSSKKQKFLTCFAFEKNKWPVVNFNLSSASGFLIWFLSLLTHGLSLINTTSGHLLMEAVSRISKWGVREDVTKRKAKLNLSWHFLWPLGREMPCLLKHFLVLSGFQLTENSWFHSQLTKVLFQVWFGKCCLASLPQANQENRDPSAFY